MGVSNDLMFVACLVPGNVSVQGHRMLDFYCGNALHKKTLCKSRINSDLDLMLIAPGKEEIFMLDNHNISPAPLLCLPTLEYF